MARAETITKLPLDRWAKLIGIHPMHFNGVYDPNRTTTPCEDRCISPQSNAPERAGSAFVVPKVIDGELEGEEEEGAG